MSEERLQEIITNFKGNLIDYIDKLQQENSQLKEDIKFCLHSIKQEKEMSIDSRTRKEMETCYEILERWNK